MSDKKAKKVERIRGAPQKPVDQKKAPNGLRNDQWEQIKDEARIRNISAAALMVQIVDWFFTALNTGRADVKTSALFDDVLTKEGSSE